MEEQQNTKFTVYIQSDEFEEKEIDVHYAETTDGIPYYICHIKGEEVQLRKDEEWEQIWGNLNQKEVEALAAEIDKHISDL